MKLLKELFALYKNGWRGGGLYVQLFTVVFLDYNFSSDIGLNVIYFSSCLY